MRHVGTVQGWDSSGGLASVPGPLVSLRRNGANVLLQRLHSRASPPVPASTGTELSAEQLLADEFAWGNAAGAGEEAAAGVGHELVHHVELGEI